MLSELAAWAGAVVGLASLVVAIIALVKSGRAQGKAITIQQRIVEIEEQRDQDRRSHQLQANFRSELRTTARHTYRLYLINTGTGEARNIRVEMDDTPLAQHPAAASGSPMPNVVGPNSEISCLLGPHMGCSPPFKLKVTWDDDAGQDRTYSTILTR